MEGVSKELGGRTLFRDLSFTLTPGARLGLLGLNGTGKTTLLRILASELQPDAGHPGKLDFGPRICSRFVAKSMVIKRSMSPVSEILKERPARAGA